jgi:predicted HAD superfamily phosphohydrolase YqeG
MIKYKGKEYKTIVWDWRSTLYDPNNESLYPWVEDYIKHSKVNHILVSWAANPQRRIELINSFSIMKEFKEIIVTGNKKRVSFEYLFDKEEIDPETTIVIGDNVNDEIALAKDMGIDCSTVEEFVKENKLAK